MNLNSLFEDSKRFLPIKNTHLGPTSGVAQHCHDPGCSILTVEQRWRLRDARVRSMSRTAAKNVRITVTIIKLGAGRAKRTSVSPSTREITYWQDTTLRRLQIALWLWKRNIQRWEESGAKSRQVHSLHWKPKIKLVRNMIASAQ